jgi:hypothetical protein
MVERAKSLCLRFTFRKEPYYERSVESLVAAVGRTLRRKLRTFGRAAQPERGHSWRPRPVALPIAPGDARPRDAEFPRCMAPHLFPLPSGFWPPDSSSHSQVPVGKSDQPFSTPSPGSPSAFDVLGQSPIAAPVSDGWQRSTPQTSLQPDRAGNFTSPAEALNSANYWNGAPTPPRMNAGPMPDSRYPLLPTMIAPTWDAVTSRATVRPAELV